MRLAFPLGALAVNALNLGALLLPWRLGRSWRDFLLKFAFTG